MRIPVVPLVLLFLLLAVPAWGQELPPEEIDALNEDCLACHEDMEEDEKEYVFPSGEVIYFQLDGDAIRRSAHGEILACSSCHGEEYADDHPDFSEPSERGYAKARSELCQSCHEEIHPRHSAEAEDAPMCTDCHSAHADRSFETEPLPILNRCGRCHESEFEDFKAGGHAEAVSETSLNRDLPNCNTCHPAHGDTAGDQLPMIARVTTLCIDCHSNSLLILKYEREGSVVTSYMDDFHGLTFQHLVTGLKGTDSSEIMTCATCHGAHDVGPLTEEEVVAVCANCHDGASTRFAGAWLGHGEVGLERGAIVWIVRIGYQFLIPIMLIGLLVHIIIQILHHRRTHADEVSEEEAETVEGLPSSVQRFSKLERAQHSAVIFLFSMLVLTGIPQSYPSSGLAGAVIDFWGGIFAARLIHRTCGFVFVTLLAAHVVHAVILTLRSHERPEILPTAKDFRDIIASLRHHLGLGPAPRFGKFDYGEKFEYWGFFLGGCLIGGTGILLVFPEFATTYLPGVILAAARLAHGYEATLAVLVVLIWHLWGVTLRPEVFPLDTTMLTGKMSLRRLREEHTLEYERLVAERNKEAAVAGKEGVTEPLERMPERAVPPG